MDRTPQQIGRANRRAGTANQLAFAAWLRDTIWPYAEMQHRNGTGDITATWDINVETTIAGWDQIWIKLEQSAHDARRRGLSLYCVVKKRQGKHDPGESAVLMPAKIFFPMVAELEKRQRQEADAELAYEKGYAAGYRAGEQGE